MLHPSICPKCFQPNEPARKLCWKCMQSLAILPEQADYVRLFELKESWALTDLKMAYHRLARKYHPDVNPGNREADAQFKFVNQAYELLSHISRRAVEQPPKPAQSAPAPQRVPAEPEPDIASDELYEKLAHVILKSRKDKAKGEKETKIEKLGHWFKDVFHNESDEPKKK